jgi:hypothetical protein
MPTSPRGDAQRRTDRIRVFRQELDALRAEGLMLPLDREAEIRAHHDRVLATLAREFDVDRTEGAGHLARGLQLVSLFGAATLVATVTTFMARVWGDLSLPAQVTLLTIFPLLSLAGVQVAAVRERTLYVASLFAIVACGTAWVAILMTARGLDIPFSVLLLWPATAVGLAVAVSYGFRVVLAMSLVPLVLAVAAAFFAAAGAPWTLVFQRLEPLAVSAFGLRLLAAHLDAAGERFGLTGRLVGLVIGLAALLGLASVEGTSLLPLAPAGAARFHQAVMLVVTTAVLGIAIRRGDMPTMYVASGYLALFLLIRYIDWFWDRLPAWAFFLTLTLAAFAGIAVLRRLRRNLGTA